MSYQLKASESVPKGIKRIVSKQIEKAINELAATDDLGMDEAVHQARRRLKKIRAVVRLVRDRLGKKTYQRENARFRDLGGSLASLRDGGVRIKTLDSLTAHYADTIEPDTFSDIARELRVDYRREYQNVVDEGITIAVKNQLKDAKEEIADWAISPKGWSAIDSSFKRVYKRGYQALDVVRSHPNVENLHDLRKRVKYLRYQLKILSPIWPKITEAWIDRTHELSDYLGEDHDLAVLKQLVLAQPERFDRQNSLSILANLIDRRREELQSAAIFLGRRIYTEKPSAFVDRMGNYWEIWQSEI
jgi:CHAD domain-containing protein